ncbi:MAG: ankyrin repeat domain-containing protein [Alphaproteobacteria bacterium]|nr:ankyrin repeat domain-containing protein [Alphaproteobacteria bacterium]
MFNFKSTAIFLSCFLSLSTALADSAILYDIKDLEFKTENDREKVYRNNELFEGAVVIPDDQGRRMTYIYRQGEKNGVAVAKYPNDNLEIEITYMNGLKNGETISFYSNGKPELKETIKNDVLHGERVEFYENGKPKEQSFYENGQLNGTTTTFDDQGNVQKIENYRNGVKNGVERIVKNNILREENNYVDGKIDGVSKKYGEKFLEEEINYKNGVREGLHKIYKEDGSLTEIPYVNGLKEGTSKSYYSDTSLASQTEYHNDHKNGPAKIFYTNHKPREIERYKNDKLDGIARHFDEQGYLKNVAYYIDGIKLAEVDLAKDATLNDLYQVYKKGKLAHYSNKKNLWYPILWLGLNEEEGDILAILKRDMDMFATPLGDEGAYRAASKSKFTEYNRNLFFGLSPLSYALNISADTSILQNFISNINERNERGTTALQEAINLNDLQSVKYLLLNGADISKKDNRNESVFFDALKSNAHYDIISALLKAGADINSKDKAGQSPLMIAMQHKNKRLMELFLENDADVKEVTPDGKTLLFYAYTKKAPSDVIDTLLDSKININQKDKKGNTILMEALKKGDNDFALRLLQKGADVNIADAEGNSALSYVLDNEVPQEVKDKVIEAAIPVTGNLVKFNKPLWKVLLDRNDLEHLKVLWNTAKNINVPDVNNEIPLYTALGKSENADLVDLTLSYVPQAGPDLLWMAIKSKNLNFLTKIMMKNPPVNFAEDGENVLTYMIKNDYALDFIKAVEVPSLNINALNSSNEDALELAIGANKPEIVNNLVRRGANINRIINGKNYLQTLGTQQGEITKILLERGISQNASLFDGQTILMVAVNNLNMDLFFALLSQNEDVNARDYDGNSAILYLADAVVKYKKLDENELKIKFGMILDTLISKGVDINTQNGAGETLLMRIAKMCPEKYELFEPMLLEKGLSPDLQNQYGKKASDLLQAAQKK